MLPQTKFFTIEEVNAVLPRVDSILSRLIEKKESHNRQHDYHFMSELLHEAMKTKNPSHSLEEPSAQWVDEGILDLEGDLDQIKAIGCFLRSLDRGWVEFPGLKNGETVYFCWKKGESQVAYYRPAKAAAFERFPL